MLWTEQDSQERGKDILVIMEIEKPTEDAAIVSWENMIKNKIIDHIYKFNPDKHPKYIKQKIKLVEKDAFGYNAFGINYKLPGIKVVINEIKKLLKIYIVRKKFEFTSI